MPVSHVGLTVSHIPSSSSFFLAALSPLGYRFVGKLNDRVGFGTDDADFFLSPEEPGVKSSTAHVAFSATSRLAVRDFYAAALTAGGQPNGAPASRGWNGCIFNAAVLDLDGNSIEVIYHEDENDDTYTTTSGSSRVLDHRKGIVNVLGDDDRSTFVPNRTSPSGSKAPSVAHATSTPASAPSSNESSSRSTSNTVIGAVLGAAAGAAIAYAMVKSERDSAKQEAEFAEVLSEKAASKAASKVAPYQAQAKTVVSSATTSKTAKKTEEPNNEGRSAYSKKKHRNYSTTESVVASRANDVRDDSDVESEVTVRPPKPRSSARAIEAASDPQPLDSADAGSYQNPTYVSLAPSRVSRAPQTEVMSRVRPRAPSRTPTERQIEYVPAASRAPTEREAEYAPASRTPSERQVEYIPATSRAPTEIQSGYVPAASRAPTEREVEHIPAASRAPAERQVEYIPAASVASQRPSTVTSRTITAPPSAYESRRYIEDVPAPQSHQSDHSWTPEDLIVARRDSVLSMYSTHSNKSKHSHHSRSDASRSHRSGHRDRSADRESIATDSSRRSHRSSKHGGGSSSHHSTPASHHSTSSSHHSTPSSHHSTSSRRSSKHHGSVTRDASPSSKSNASTIKASQTDAHSYYYSAAEMPLPGSRQTSIVSAQDMPLPGSRKTSIVSAQDMPLPASRKTSIVSAQDMPLPASRKTSIVSAQDMPLPNSRKTSVVSAQDMPLPTSRKTSLASYAEYPLPESRNPSIIDDLETVVPDDSISCVGTSRHRGHSTRREEGGDEGSRHSRRGEDVGDGGSRHSGHSSRKHRSRHEGSSRSERRREDASEVTVKESMGRRLSAATLPLFAKSRSGIERGEKKGKRSVV